MDHKILLEKIKADNVKFISLQFTDVIGAVKSVDIPAPRLEKVLKEGIWFDGSSVRACQCAVSRLDAWLKPNGFQRA